MVCNGKTKHSGSGLKAVIRVNGSYLTRILLLGLAIYCRILFKGWPFSLDEAKKTFLERRLMTM